MAVRDRWADGAAYERYMGRWSSAVAERFVAWLEPERGGRWLDVGCGTGALTEQVLRLAAPAEVVGVDPTQAFLDVAARRLGRENVRFLVAGAESLPVGDADLDAAVSGLVLNFVPDPGRAVAELRRAVRPGGLVAAYVWDYSDGMVFLREFWDAAADLDPSAADLDEGRRFPLARREGIAKLLAAAGLEAVESTGITVPTRFADFDDLWSPFLAGQAPAPSYVASLPAAARERLRAELESRLPREPDGSIALTAGAWATRGLRP